MGHERIKHIKDNLLSCIENQVCNIYEADAEELGKAVDMLKDLEEALYYCTITEAMEQKENPEGKYNNGGSSMSYNNGGRSYSNGGQQSYSRYSNSMSNYSEPYWKDEREGRSPNARRMYMESKEKHQDKSLQMKELEKYVQELSSDLVEMIQDATSEEKGYLEKKMISLASKIGQMK